MRLGFTAVCPHGENIGDVVVSAEKNAERYEEQKAAAGGEPKDKTAALSEESFPAGCRNAPPEQVVDEENDNGKEGEIFQTDVMVA